MPDEPHDLKTKENHAGVPLRGGASASLKLISAVASGLLVAGLFPPYGLVGLAWFAMVPLIAALWSIRGRRAGWRGFLLGWLAGVIASAIQFSWLSEVSWLGACLLPMYLGCFWGVFGWFAATIGNPWRRPVGVATAVGAHRSGYRAAMMDCGGSLRTAICHAAVWAGLEWLRGWLFTGFGWNGLGVAFHQTPVMAQAADLLGVAGLSMMLVFFQAVMVQAGARRLQVARKLCWCSDVLVAVLMIGLWAGYGMMRIAIERHGDALRLRTLLVQINIPQDAAQVLWSALDVHMAYENETLEALEPLAAKDGGSVADDANGVADAPSSLPDWVMWPECALTGRILTAGNGEWGAWQENQETIRRVREPGGFHLFYGVNEMEADSLAGGQLVPKAGGRIWNSLAVMSPQDELQLYRKHHLVIFGETIPFVETIPWLKAIYKQQAGVDYSGSFSAGESFEPLSVATASGEKLSAIPTICFEDTVPRLTRKFVRPGPQVIVNVTNDGWFRESPAAAQHFANARFRAIELRRPMLRCANSGVSAAIDSTGSTAHPDSGKPQVLVDAKGGHFTRGSLLTELEVPLHPSFSLYALAGDVPLLVLALGAWLWAWRSSRHGGVCGA